MLDPNICLIGGLEQFIFFHILGIITPTDFHIFQRGRSTTNQIGMVMLNPNISGSCCIILLVGGFKHVLLSIIYGTILPMD